MPLPVCETPELFAEFDASQVCIRWRGLTQRVVKVEHDDGHICTTLIIEPSRRPAIPIVGTLPVDTEVPLNDCERDIVAVMRRAGHAMTKGQIIEALEAAELLHGESTIGYAIASLKARGIILSPGRGKRGGYVLKS